jgi:hypothetical protein
LIQNASGATNPLAEAQVDVYRTDMAAKYNTKTDKKGQFVFAGLPYAGTNTVTASHPIASPSWVAGVRSGRDMSVELKLGPGDGKRLTLAEIRAASGEAPTGAEASAQAARDELARKNAEIQAANAKIMAVNETIARTFAAGNAALTAAGAASSSRDSDGAIRQFTLAIAQ